MQAITKAQIMNNEYAIRLSISSVCSESAICLHVCIN